MIAQSLFLAASSAVSPGVSVRRYAPDAPSTPPRPPLPGPEFLKLFRLREADVRGGELANGKFIGLDATGESPDAVAFCVYALECLCRPCGRDAVPRLALEALEALGCAGWFGGGW